MDLWFYSVDSWVKNIRFLPPPFLSRLRNQPFCQEHRHDIKKHLGRSRASEMAVLTTETTKNYITAIIWKPKSEKIVAVGKRMLDTKRYTKVTIYIFNFSTQPSSTLTWQVHMVSEIFSTILYQLDEKGQGAMAKRPKKLCLWVSWARRRNVQKILMTKCCFSFESQILWHLTADLTNILWLLRAIIFCRSKRDLLLWEKPDWNERIVEPPFGIRGAPSWMARLFPKQRFSLNANPRTESIFGGNDD